MHDVKQIDEVQKTDIFGIFTISSNPFQDKRGRFSRLFDRDLLAAAQIDRPIIQINHSLTRQIGALRGMHFQKAPFLEAKWVRCIRGRVYDVAVDLRHGSPTFLNHVAIELSEEASNAIFIPEGCAHGFQVIEPDSELLYLHTAQYAPQAEGGVRWDDPRLAIAWPLPAVDISQRDMGHPLLSESFEGLKV